ncbi:hypothetical protein E2C01_071915 [Portunus trituberculatus]|uniref:Uncharacterized protein n=1 Tax=Portunus trituberculatus TaxID=210409 RepID=A0A5B7HWK5_PORTR|nr:hypothetical protein [Portunus trituberculatus]
MPEPPNVTTGESRFPPQASRPNIVHRLPSMHATSYPASLAPFLLRTPGLTHMHCQVHIDIARPFR